MGPRRGWLIGCHAGHMHASCMRNLSRALFVGNQSMLLTQASWIRLRALRVRGCIYLPGSVGVLPPHMERLKPGFSDALANRLGGTPRGSAEAPELEVQAPAVRASKGDLRRRLDPQAAFTYWAALGPTRSYAAVAREFGVQDSTVLRRAKRMKWDERLARIEAPQREEDEQKLREAVADMNTRQVQLAQDLVRKGADSLVYLEPTSVAEALRLCEVGAKLERQALGEPESRKTLTIETILRERFEDLVAHNEPRTIDAEFRPRRQVTIDVPNLDDDDEGGDE